MLIDTLIMSMNYKGKISGSNSELFQPVFYMTCSTHTLIVCHE